ncbi:protein of unknown function [Methylocaldum szegediense]|uniref:Uncharacterized protein n=1 Tax=Methylocaldum szegediense TaxID=73780 RepID=A0ABM9I5X1_9GAMM|nr:protein of unknown function [Methylocaldum szegediense]
MANAAQNSDRERLKIHILRLLLTRLRLNARQSSLIRGSITDPGEIGAFRRSTALQSRSVHCITNV